MSRLFERAQQFGKSFMLPIAVLPAAGLLLGIGGALSNPNKVQAYPFLDITWLQHLFTIMAAAGSIGIANSDKGTAGLAAMLGYLIMNATINAMLQITGELMETDLASAGQGMALGIQTLETGVFGEILIGVVTALLHNRYNKQVLPQFLGFFSGSRFVPIIMSFVAIGVGIGLYFICQSGISSLGGLVDKTGYIRTFIDGFALRMLGPFGLHHIFYIPFLTTDLGGSMVIDGTLIEGTQKIFFAQLADPSTTQFYEGTARFMSGRFMMAHTFEITIGQTFSGRFIDFILFGILQGNDKTNWMLVLVIGAFCFLLYYVTFRFLITKFNFMTPGRSDETATKAADVDASDLTTAIIAALSGDANIDTIDCCATRLRVTVNDHQHVREDLLKAMSAHGVVQKGNGIQVIYGPSVTIIKNEVQESLGRGE